MAEAQSNKQINLICQSVAMQVSGPSQPRIELRHCGLLRSDCVPHGLELIFCASQEVPKRVTYHRIEPRLQLVRYYGSCCTEVASALARILYQYGTTFQM